MPESTTETVSQAAFPGSNVRPKASKESFTSIFASRKRALVDISTKSVLSSDSHSSLAVAPWYPRDTDSNGGDGSSSIAESVRYPSHVSLQNLRNELYVLRLDCITNLEKTRTKLQALQVVHPELLEEAAQTLCRIMGPAFDSKPLEDSIALLRASYAGVIALTEEYILHLSDKNQSDGNVLNSSFDDWTGFFSKFDALMSKHIEAMANTRKLAFLDEKNPEKSQSWLREFRRALRRPGTSNLRAFMLLAFDPLKW